MRTIVSLINDAASYLEKKGIKGARRQAEEVISLTLNIPRLDLYLDFDRPVSEPELEYLRDNIKKRAEGMPPQYIKGEVDFLGCRIKVSPSVLIPRNETEILTDRVIKELSLQNLKEKILLDLCCGSGCIGIAIKKKLPELNVYLSDLSKDAIEIAAQNSEINEVDVAFLHGDLLEPFKGNKAHFIVCNPPYISQKDFDSLDREVKEFEPKRALVGGITGLEYYEKLSRLLPEHLYDCGKIYLEIGFDQGEKVKNIFQKPCLKNVSVAKDWAGHDRFFSCVYDAGLSGH